MHVNNFAPFEVFVEEMAHAVLCLCHSWQELLLYNFSVVTMTENFILLILIPLVFNFSKAGFSHLSHNALFLGIHHVIQIIIVKFIVLFFFVKGKGFHARGFLTFHRFGVLFCFILDCLLQHHLLSEC